MGFLRGRNPNVTAGRIGNHPSKLRTGTGTIGSNSFVLFPGRGTLSKPNIVFRFRQNLALLQPRLDIFLDYLDKLGIRRYPILVVAHTSDEEHWTVTNESLILVGPRHEQGITVTGFPRVFDRSANIFFFIVLGVITVSRASNSSRRSVFWSGPRVVAPITLGSSPSCVRDQSMPFAGNPDGPCPGPDHGPESQRSSGRSHQLDAGLVLGSLFSARITPEQVAERSHAPDYSVLVPADIPAPVSFGRSFAPISTTHLEGFLCRPIGSCPEAGQIAAPRAAKSGCSATRSGTPLILALICWNRLFRKAFPTHQISATGSARAMEMRLSIIYLPLKAIPSNTARKSWLVEVPMVRPKKAPRAFLCGVGLATYLRCGTKTYDSGRSHLRHYLGIRFLGHPGASSETIDTFSRGWHPTDGVIGRRLSNHLDYPLAK